MKSLEEIDLENSSLEELEVQMRHRDAVAKKARDENAVLKKAADRHHVRIQTEATGRAPQNLTQGVRFEIGGQR